MTSAAIPDCVDGARIVWVGRYRPADAEGSASATVLVDWGDDDELPRWGSHVLTYEPSFHRYLLWQVWPERYFNDLREAWDDLRNRWP